MSREKFNIEDLDVLELERLRELAKTRGATKKTQEVDTIPRVPRHSHLPSSFSQQRLWFLSQQEENGEKYHVPAALRLTGVLDKDALRRAIRAIVARHEALRSVFVWDEGQLHVELLSPESVSGLVETDLCNVEDADDQLEGILLEERFAPFDLSRDAPIRVRLVQLAKDDHVLLITQHHIASDGWSMGIFAHELQTLYTAFRAGLPNPLAALPIQYPDYAAWQRQWLTDERIDAQVAYWRRTLEGVPHLLELPTSHRRPEVQSFVGARMPVHIDASLSDRVKRLGQAHGCTPFIVVLAAWAAVLSRVSGQDDLVLGTPSANRGRRETEGLIGFFVNTLALRIGLGETASVSDLLAHVRTTVLSAQKHQDLPFEQVVEIARPPRSMSHAPLFQVMLLWQSNEGRLPELPGVDISLLEANYVPVKYDMELELSDSAGEIVGGLTYATALFDAATAERYVAYLQATLRAMVTDATQPVAGIDMLSSSERDTLLGTWNATSTPYAKDVCVHALFERQAARSPDSVAITCDGQSLTYAQLNARANGLAHHLIGQGVGPDVPVVICVGRGLPMVVGLLGVMKAGGAYVPLDPAYPSQRLIQVCDEAKAPIALVDRAGRTALGESLPEDGRVVDLDAMDGWPLRIDNPVVDGLTPDRLMYVIYTSGSTGVPKGVMVEHGSVVNFLGAMADTVGIVEADRLLAVTSLSFDIAALEIFLPLMVGARIVMARRDDVVDAGVLQSMLASERITMMQATPATWNTLIAMGWQGDPALSILCGGEAMSALLADGLAIRGKQVWNLYGPTETTIWSSCARIERTAASSGRPPSIGRPIANTRIYLLDAHGQPVPRGTTGELYIGGDGVARGYLNRPALTAERFVDDPFAGTVGARMYRTGDLARYLPDGEIECLGRNDHQVKIRGFRIELGEIEARLAKHPAVREAVVLAREDIPGEKRLVAYVIGADGAIPEASSLRTHVAAGLPEYMVPAAFVPMDAWPLTPNGKLDRKALPTPEGEDYLRREYAAPQGETEAILAGLWQELLGVERVSRRDHFFELGGHSLLAVLLIERLRKEGRRMDIRALFATPILSDLAVGLDQAEDEALPPSAIQPDSPAITPSMLPLIDLVQADIDRIVERTPGGVANIQDIYALTSLQDGILFHHMLAEEGDPYLLSTLMAFPSRALLDRFLATVQTVVDRHDILRTAFHWEGLSTPAQVVWRHAPLAVFEIALDPADGPVERQLAERFDSHRHRMDLGRAPLLHFAIAHDPSNDRWVVLQRLHHLVGDHSTLDVLREEVRQLFAGRTDLAPPQPFRRLVARIRRGLSAQEHERFFRDMLGDVTEPTLPFGLADLHDAAPVGMVSLPLSASLNGRLRAQARRLGVGVASLCHLAWGQVLARSSGQEQVVFGTVLFGRMQAGEASQGVGLFINTLPLRLDLGAVGAEEAVRQTHTRLTELLVHEHASLALAQRCSGVDASTPLFSSLFNYRHQVAVNGDEVAVDDDPMEGVLFLGDEVRNNYPLTLSVEDFGNALAVTTLARDPLSPARICDYMRQALESVADALEREPGRAMRGLEVLPDTERRLLLDTWNTALAPSAQDISVHAMFERQAADAPDAIAVICGDDSLTYGELNAQANRLAHHLIERGVGPDERVALCAERGLPMVVGLLGILKAGGAYVPLDPAYPVERLLYLLEDSRPRACLVDAAGALRLQGRNVSTPVVRLDKPDALRDIVDDPSIDVTPDHLAYVIYTSGSTGAPKGVMVSHRQLESYLAYARASYLPGMAGSVVSSALGFDATITTLLPSLSAGKTVCLLPDDDTTMAALSQRLFAPGEGWLFKITPAHLQGLFHGDRPARGDAAHCIVIGGEQLPASTLRTWKGSLLPRATFVNEYGPTETVVGCSVWILKDGEGLARLDGASATPIGRAMGHAQLYVLDAHGRPVPMRSEGELYIGGAGVARGYFDRPALTAERFVDHPYRPGERLYRTGDRVRHIDDEGNLEFLGRLDEQVKIRGFRIEPGEIEARLGTHAQVREAVVLAREDIPGEKRLVAYVIGADGAIPEASSLRTHVAAGLPEYMVPAAFVPMDAWPLTPNGKLDRKALPTPEGEDYLRREYAAPQGETEAILAGLWQELLGVERVSRRDHFFELGGHSLLAVLLIERLRKEGRRMDIRALFATPILSDLAVGLDQAEDEALPPSAIQPDSPAITPSMLPLIDLVQADIDRIVERTPGGVANIQDIYALTSLQDGILFHHMLAEEGDPYLLSTLMAFPSRALLDRFLATVQTVVDRHDILRTAFHWEGLSTPAQVVWRHAPLAVFEIALDPADGPVERQLAERFDSHRHRMDLGRAPLLHFAIAHDPSNDRWVVLQRLHHLVGDHSTLDVLREEVRQLFAGRTDLAPPQPFRRLVARIRRGLSAQEHERFFRDMLGDVTEPTLPFGLADLHDAAPVGMVSLPLSASLNGRLRAQARRLGVGVASLCHLAWGQVLARSSGQEQVVFGTVLFGRMQAGEASQGVGLFINTLPLRLDLGAVGAEEAVRQTHTRLTELLVHEHASLALAQRCSGVDASTPLFSSLFNYRHQVAVNGDEVAVDDDPMEGVLFLGDEVRNNYPLTLSVEDFGNALAVTTLARDPLSPARICDYMRQALESVADALEREPRRAVRELEVLPDTERQLLDTWNTTTAPSVQDVCVHAMFERQVADAPDAIAVICGDDSLTYGELNAQANRLAHHLIARGVAPDGLVAICAERGLPMVVGMLGVLKAGGAYVPLDPAYASERLAVTLADAAPSVVLADATGRAVLGVAALADRHVVDLDSLDTLPARIDDPVVDGLTPDRLMYVIYTSGSTGVPKGVMVEHRSVVNFHHAMSLSIYADARPGTRVGWNASFSFDMSIKGFAQLLSGHCLVIVPQEARVSGKAFMAFLQRQQVDAFDTTPSQLKAMIGDGLLELERSGTWTVLIGGEPIDPLMWAQLQSCTGLSCFNMYGPTECTVDVTIGAIRQDEDAPHIGRVIPNDRIYLLDGHGMPVPMGAAGEIHVGGRGLARGYLRQPELTAARFVADPFDMERPGARMYKTGDMGMYLPDGRLRHLGRNDRQVKVRGFRVELGEIEARLAEHPLVRASAVVARSDKTDGTRIIGYYVFDPKDAPDPSAMASILRTHMAERLPDYMIPSAFVGMDALPLTTNGKLDQNALPDPDAAAYASKEFVAPRGELEVLIADLWQALLEVEQVGRNDNFFDLGGHSLLAVQLMARTRQTLGINVALRELFTGPTLAEFAANVMASASGRSDLMTPNIVSLRSSGYGSPLFLVHSGGGGIDYARQLLEHLDETLPVHAIEASGLTPGKAPIDSMKVLVDRYLAQIRYVQPSGPYRIAGWSAGGVIAYQLASRLSAMGDTVAFVGLLDSYCPPIGGDPDVAPTFDEKHELLQFLDRSEYVDDAARERIREAAPALDFNGIVDMVYAMDLPSQGVEPLPIFDADSIRSLMAVRHATKKSVAECELGTVPVPVHLFEAEDNGLDASTTWKGRAELTVVRVKGSHLTMVDDPNHIRDLGHAISSAMTAG